MLAVNKLSRPQSDSHLQMCEALDPNNHVASILTDPTKVPEARPVRCRTNQASVSSGETDITHMDLARTEENLLGVPRLGYECHCARREVGDDNAAPCEACSPRWWNTIGTARSRALGEYLICLLMTPSSKDCASPVNSGRVTRTSRWRVGISGQRL